MLDEKLTVAQVTKVFQFGGNLRLHVRKQLDLERQRDQVHIDTKYSVKFTIGKQLENVVSDHYGTRLFCLIIVDMFIQLYETFVLCSNKIEWFVIFCRYCLNPEESIKSELLYFGHILIWFFQDVSRIRDCCVKVFGPTFSDISCACLLSATLFMSLFPPVCYIQ